MEHRGNCLETYQFFLGIPFLDVLERYVTSELDKTEIFFNFLEKLYLKTNSKISPKSFLEDNKRFLCLSSSKVIEFSKT